MIFKIFFPLLSLFLSSLFPVESVAFSKYVELFSISRWCCTIGDGKKIFHRSSF